MTGITRPRRTTPAHRTDAIGDGDEYIGDEYIGVGYNGVHRSTSLTPPERRSRRTPASVLHKSAGTGNLTRRTKARAMGPSGTSRRSYTLPPVMARGTVQDMAVPSRKRSQPRHRYDFALSIPGAEVRLPSMPAVRIGWRGASGILVILMSLSLYILLYTPAFQVDVLEVEGMQRLTLEDINSELSISGESIVKVDPENLYAELQAAFPELSSIQVKVYLPAKVKLEVVERVPVIDWVQGSGDGDGYNGSTEEKWIDLEGYAFPPRGEAGSLIRVEADSDEYIGYIGDGLPQPATAMIPAGTSDTAMKALAVHTPMLPPEMVSTLLAMGAYVPAGTPILYSTEHGFGWQDPNGWRVYFGKSLVDADGYSISQKLLVYQHLQENLANQGIQPSLISVEFLHAPFYRTER